MVFTMVFKKFFTGEEKEVIVMAPQFSLVQMVIFLVIGFILGAMSGYWLSGGRVKINVRVFFEVIPEREYDDDRYRGEVEIGREGEDIRQDE